METPAAAAQSMREVAVQAISKLCRFNSFQSELDPLLTGSLIYFFTCPADIMVNNNVFRLLIDLFLNVHLYTAPSLIEKQVPRLQTLVLDIFSALLENCTRSSVSICVILS